MVFQPFLRVGDRNKMKAIPSNTDYFFYAVFISWLIGCTDHFWPNVAPSGTAHQSSTYSGGLAWYAIDGDRNPNYGERSCTHTAFESAFHWWSLRLPAEYLIEEISITNRNAAYERINNAEILIGNSLENNGNNNPRCAVILNIPSGATRTFKCRMVGGVVNVRLNQTDFETSLTMCEVEVYGEPAPPSVTFQTLSRSIVVVKKNLCWSDALFYCRDYYTDLISIHNKNEQEELESHLRGILGNASSPLTNHVWLGLRRRVMGSTWFWMSGGALGHTHWENEPPWPITSPCSGMDTSEPFNWKNLPCANQLYFICSSGDRLYMDRVQFYSTRRPRE